MLLSFALRIAVAYLIVIALMLAAVYQQHHSRLEDYVNQRFADVMTEVRVHLSTEESETVSEEMGEVLQQMQIPYLEAYGGKGRLLHAFASQSWTALKEDTPLPHLPGRGKKDLSLVERGGTPYLRIATGPAEIKNPFGRPVTWLSKAGRVIAGHHKSMTAAANPRGCAAVRFRSRRVSSAWPTSLTPWAHGAL